MLDPGQPFRRSYPACAESVPRARIELTEYARAAGAAGERLEKIRLAASEAVTNAVLHAYEASGGRVEVSAAHVSGGELLVLVTDKGAGLRVRRNSRGLGLGLALIAQLVDDFQILSRGTGGTELRMEFRLDSDAPPRTPAGEAQSWRGSVSAAVSPA